MVPLDVEPRVLEHAAKTCRISKMKGGLCLCGSCCPELKSGEVSFAGERGRPENRDSSDHDSSSRHLLKCFYKYFRRKAVYNRKAVYKNCIRSEDMYK